MTEKGTVTELKDRLVTVQLEMTASCGACNNAGCKVSRHALQAYNKDEVSIDVGDEVELQIEGKEQLAGALWVLGLPLALFVGGYALARFLFPSAATEAPAALSGIAGLLLGGFVGVLVQKGKRLDSLPRVLRKVDAREPDEDEIAAAEARLMEYAEG